MTTPRTDAAAAARQAEFRKRLAAARLRLARAVATTDQERRALAAHEAQDADDAAADVLAGLLERLEGRERQELDEIAAAQARIEAGLYGICESCHRPIPLARLRAMPATRRCAVCQTQHEARR